ncbi:MAG: UDP-2,3-diacylglucosamine diphosphatase LpxI, partial [Elusimicrobiota bacterium]
LSRFLKFFRQEGVEGVMLAGTVDHAKALQTKEAIQTLTDPRALKMILSVRKKNAVSLLSAVIAEIEKDGMRVLPSFAYLEDHLLKPGPAGPIKPSKSQLEDIETGYRAAKTLSGLDIGLSCCVAAGAVVAVEAMEGTDQCIARAGEILTKRSSNKGQLTVVKVARPQQDPRFDLPVIGPQTILTASRAGAKCLAAEAGWTLVLDYEETLKLALNHGIAVYGINADSLR